MYTLTMTGFSRFGVPAPTRAVSRAGIGPICVTGNAQRGDWYSIGFARSRSIYGTIANRCFGIDNQFVRFRWTKTVPHSQPPESKATVRLHDGDVEPVKSAVEEESYDFSCRMYAESNVSDMIIVARLELCAAWNRSVAGIVIHPYRVATGRVSLDVHSDLQCVRYVSSLVNVLRDEPVFSTIVATLHRTKAKVSAPLPLQERKRARVWVSIDECYSYNKRTNSFAGTIYDDLPTPRVIESIQRFRKLHLPGAIGTTTSPRAWLRLLERTAWCMKDEHHLALVSVRAGWLLKAPLTTSEAWLVRKPQTSSLPLWSRCLLCETSEDKIGYIYSYVPTIFHQSFANCSRGTKIKRRALVRECEYRGRARFSSRFMISPQSDAKFPSGS